MIALKIGVLSFAHCDAMIAAAYRAAAHGRTVNVAGEP